MGLHANSFIRFIYPFRFDNVAFDDLVPIFLNSDETKPVNQIWETESYPMDDMLNHVRNHFIASHQPSPETPTAIFLKLKNKKLESYRYFGAQCEWFCHSRKKNIQFAIEKVILVLFRTNVGFLIFDAQPVSLDLQEWLDFIHFFRFTYGREGVYIRIERKIKEERELIIPLLGEPDVEKYVQLEDKERTFRKIVIDRLLAHFFRLCERGIPTIQDIFIPNQLLVWYCLIMNSDDASPSPSQQAEILYRLRNCFSFRHSIFLTELDETFQHPGLMEYAREKWFVFSLEGGGFVGFGKKTKFFTETVPDHVEKQYFLLYLLALHQKFALIKLSEDVSRYALIRSFKKQITKFQELKKSLQDYTARCSFIQVMQRSHHHRVYKKWLEILEIPQFYQEVRDEIKEIHEHLSTEQNRLLDKRIGFLGAFIGIPALVLSFLGINIQNITSNMGLTLWTALGLTLSSFLLGAVTLELMKRLT